MWFALPRPKWIVAVMVSAAAYQAVLSKAELVIATGPASAPTTVAARAVARVPGVEDTEPKDTAKAEALITTARTYLKADQTDEAEKLVAEAITVAPPGSPLRQEANQVLADVLSRRRELAEGRGTAQLNVAQKRLDLHDYSAAETDAKAVAASLPPTSAISRRAHDLVAKTMHGAATRAADHQSLLLDNAERLIDDGKYEAAAQVIEGVAAQTADDSVAKKAQLLLAKTHPSYAGSRWHRWEEAADWLFGLLGFVGKLAAGALCLYLIWSICRVWLWISTTRYLRRAKPRQWQLEPLADATSLGVGEFVLAGFSRWNTESGSATESLLTVHASNFRLRSGLVLQSANVDLASVAETLPTINGIEFGTFAKLIRLITAQWRARRHRITGVAYVDEARVVARLTRSAPDGTVAVVSSFADKAAPSAAATVAESVSFKMYYLVSRDSSVEEANAADELREGVRLLRQYVSDSDADKLPSALKVFGRIHNQYPDMAEAELFEGIALDLLERHDAAIAKFEHVHRDAADETLRRRAMYNQAVALFRRYTVEDSERAMRLFDDLAGPRIGLAGDPLGSLSLAMEANAIAHYPIFWNTVSPALPAPRDEANRVAQKDKRQGMVVTWIKAVEGMAQEVNGIDTTDPKVWDGPTRLQLKWIATNAIGNVYLNVANVFLCAPEPSSPTGPRTREGYFRDALRAFEECATLLPSGVETLTNLATAHLGLSQFDEARKYAEEAIKLNPTYEYAYYRLAQVWDRQGNLAKVEEVLRSFTRPPQNSSFRNLFTRCGVEEHHA